MKNIISHRADVPSDAQLFSTAANKLRAKGVDVIAMHLGQPSTGAPQRAVDAVKHMMDTDTLGYTSALGIDPLRARLARMYDERYGAPVEKEQVIVTVGASLALVIALLGCFEVGDSIALPYPVYPAYANTVKMLGLKIVGVPTSIENRFQIRVADLEALPEKPNGIIVASPSNPAGTMLTPDELRDLCAYCDKHGIRLISDEIYHGIEYEGHPRAQTAAKLSKHAVVISSFSKYFSMPGWRIGWMVVPKELAGPMSKAIRNLYLAAPTPSQYAALAALDARDELDQHVVRYAKNRDLLLDGLPKAGFNKLLPPQGAFYIYAHIEHLHHDSRKFCVEMINEAGVISMPGTDFDPNHGHHFIRFSYAGKTEDIEQALERLIKWRQ
jgi:aspartate/methionine/tyrosine aminotransferase